MSNINTEYLTIFSFYWIFTSTQTLKKTLQRQQRAQKPLSPPTNTPSSHTVNDNCLAYLIASYAKTIKFYQTALKDITKSRFKLSAWHALYFKTYYFISSYFSLFLSKSKWRSSTLSTFPRTFFVWLEQWNNSNRNHQGLFDSPTIHIHPHEPRLPQWHRSVNYVIKQNVRLWLKISESNIDGRYEMLVALFYIDRILFAA